MALLAALVIFMPDAALAFTIADDFTTGTYSGNSGTQSWSAPWQEIGESDGVSTGQVRITSAYTGTGLSGNAIELRCGLVTGQGLSRQADLSGAASATLTFDYGVVHSGNATIVLSMNGGAGWQPLKTYSLTADVPVAIHESFDITTYVSVATQIRFQVTASGLTTAMYIDNVMITAALGAPSISGRVFEDVNYGGGAGRNWTTASGNGGSARPSARVELFDSTGAFVSSATTDPSGNYSFPGLAAGNYLVRVVTDSVTSSRTGYVGSLRPVLTFRTNASTGTAVDATDFVGGHDPATADAGRALAGWVLNPSTGIFTGSGSGKAHAFAPVTVSGASVSGVDFGWSLDVVTNVNDTGQGSLRQFLTNANALSNAGLAQAGRSAGIEHAIFMISNGTAAPGLRVANNYFVGAAATIAPNPSALPIVNDPVVLDGTTQPGWSSTPVVELNGSGAGVSSGLVLSANSSTIRGLAVNRFGSGGIVVNGDGNTIAGNIIGLDVTGTIDLGNANAGVSVSGPADATVIGSANAADRNVISGNGSSGIAIVGTNTVVRGNYIGTDLTGALALGNSTFGVEITAGATNNTIGGSAAGARNVISSNAASGVLISGAGTTGNAIAGNFIGLGANGSTDLGNASYGVHVASAANNTIGGVSAGARNVISGNGLVGVLITGSGTTGTLVQGNYIGTDSTGLAARGNTSAGVMIDNGATGNTVGGTAAGSGNVIAGNGSHGIYLTSGGNTVQGNTIGLNATGGTALANASGITITTAGNVIGGTSVAARNVISGNSGDGVAITNAGATGNLVQGNFIGTDRTGLLDRGNGNDGVGMSGGASGNTIGGTVSGARNVISGNNSDGVQLAGATTTNNLVRGNYIGTDSTGMAAVPNSVAGVRPEGVNNTIGGTAPGAGNVISGNATGGVIFSSTSSVGNLIQGNLIGVAANGTGALPNTYGVWIATTGGSNVIGGTAAGAGNVIGRNTQYGVFLTTSNASGNRIEGNFIGTDASGTLNLGNGSGGIYVSNNVSNTAIGGIASGAGNRVAFNGARGISIDTDAGPGTSILRNAIYANTTLGIDLGNNGVTNNDVGDPDTGLNGLGYQNYPILTSATVSGGQVRFRGTLNSDSSVVYRVEFFASAAQDPTLHGEGERYLGATTATTNASGDAVIDTTITVSVTPGEYISATATDLTTNDTSEFSTNVVAALGATIAGTVYEDVNYGGGAGRTLAASAGVVRVGARVELYDGSGNFSTFTTTDGSGDYSFPGLVPGNYTVRVANSTVTSSRTGYVAGLLPVQTFRTDASTGTAVAVTDRVGGEVPNKMDAGNGSTTLAALTTGTTTAQSVTVVALGAGNIAGINFGFCYDVIVNVNDAGQGSLRQFLANANALSNTGLAQAGRTAGIENAIWMISNGTAAPGLRAANNYFVSGVATVALQSELPLLTDPVVLNAQTQPGWTSAPIVELNGSAAGVSAIGLTLDSGSGGSTIRGLVINRFGLDGIRSPTGSHGNTIAGNYIGMSASGTVDLGNGDDGIEISTDNNVIGGTAAADRNVISGNGDEGIDFNSGAQGNTVLGNIIGLDATGAVALGNTGNGLNIEGPDNVIGGTVAGAGNVVSANGSSGIEIINATATGTIVQGNRIGTDIGGALDRGNAAAGLRLYGGTSGNTIGGSVPGARNVISGNTDGIYLQDVGTSNNVIRGNFIGTNAAGNADLGNSDRGIQIESGANNNTVGGTNPADRNVISGNDNDGVIIADGVVPGTGTTGNVVQGNYIGTDSAGVAAVGNGGHGVHITTVDGNLIGGTAAGAGNLIANSAWNGVDIQNDSATGNGILGNVIRANGGLAIDLRDDGVTLNDGTKNAARANSGMDYPVIITAALSGTTLTLAGYVGSGPGQAAFANARVEIFEADGDVSNHGEGLTYLGFVAADASGNFSGTVDVSGKGLVIGDKIGGTATDGSNNTSEFGVNVTVTGTVAISGTIFEDVDYGGGAGRDSVSAAGVGRASARVELYDGSGNFSTSTTTDASGHYSFPTLVPGTYTVRVVNSTVTSSRAGYVAGLLAVQTFRSDASTGTAVPVTDRVGGEVPNKVDAGNGSTTLAALTTGTTTAQSVTVVALGAGSITGVDFGYCFDAIVNVNDTGQGSLRQFLTNANALSNTGLAQAGRTAGIEHAIWMISNGTAAPGLRAANNYFVSGVATIAPTSAEPSIGQPSVIDARTQPGWSGTPVVRIDGVSAGPAADGISFGASGDGGLVAGLMITRFSRDGVVAQPGADSVRVQGNWIGTAGTGTTGTGNGDDGIDLNGMVGALIGGTGSADGNVVTNSADAGITVTHTAATGHRILGNIIGLDPDGSTGTGNGDVGIAFLSSAGNNTVGGPTPGERNIVAMNFEGIEIGTPNNVVQGNYFGTDLTGTLNRGQRSSDAVQIITAGSNNRIGGAGPGEGNLIAFTKSGWHGVSVRAGSGNAVLGNRTWANTGLGIELGNNGVSANDGAKTGGAANLLMDHPVFTSATLVGTTLTVAGYVGSSPGQSTFANARVEVFESDNDGTGFGEGMTYLGFLTSNASGNFSGSLDVTGKGLVVGDKVTGTATDGSNNTSEFGANATVTAGATIAGTVFEDVNYGGGAGRTLAASAGVVRSGARVELYDGSGNFSTFTTTDASGNYSFPSLAPGNYTIRVVNSTMTSSRTGYVAGLLPAQTFRTDASTGTAVAVTDRVGGEVPNKVDAGNGSTTLAALTTGTTTAQSVTSVALGAASITGVDFGYCFDVIVNVNNSGQGSLRQFLTNAAALGGEPSLVQSGSRMNVGSPEPLPVGRESSIFMISDGLAHPGLRTGLPNQLTSGVAVISVSGSMLPALSGANAGGTVIDGTTQTANVGDTNSGTMTSSGAVGLGPDALPGTGDEPLLTGVQRPEVQVQGSSGIAYGLRLSANDITLRGLSVYGFSSGGLQANVLVGDASAVLNNTGCVLEQNILGTPATSFTDPGPGSRSGNINVYVRSAQSGILRQNAFGFVVREHIRVLDGRDWVITDNEIRQGGLGGSFGGVTLISNSSGQFLRNLVVDDLAQAVLAVNGTIGAQDNTISGNSGTGIGFFQNPGTPGTGQISRNEIVGNSGAGVAVLGVNGASPATTQVRISQNRFAGNGGISIDLLPDWSSGGISPNDGVLLGDSTVANACGTITSAGNEGLDTPVIVSATRTGGLMTVVGRACPAAEVEVYLAVPDGDGSDESSGVGYGEGTRFLGSTFADGVTGDFTLAGIAGLVLGDEVSALAIDGSGNTSEFSANVRVLDAGITVVPTSGLVTTEAGGTATFTVVLNTQPTADVTVGLSSSDLTEGTVAPASVTFTTGNWSTPQPVTVTGQNDILVDGPVPYSIITATATSTDPAYGGLNPADVAVLNLDDDSGVAVQLHLVAEREVVEIGQPVRFTLVVRNLLPTDLPGLSVLHSMPDRFQYLNGTLQRDGQVVPDPVRSATLEIPLDTLSAFVDGNGNGRADPGEPGFTSFSWQLVPGAGATPGTYVGEAVAAQGCPTCVVSNRAEASVRVEESSLLALGTVVGRVFEDTNRDGFQNRDEAGVPGAVVAMDDGTRVTTDHEGRFHVPNVQAGPRVLKLDVGHFSTPAAMTTDEAALVNVTGGLITPVRFGVSFDRDTVRVGRPEVKGLLIAVNDGEHTVGLAGNAVRQALVLNGRPIPVRSVDARLSSEGIGEVLKMSGIRLESPAVFQISASDLESVSRWTLDVQTESDSTLKTISGAGPPPASVTWDGAMDGDAPIQGGSVYAYKITLEYVDGMTVRGPKRMFGVDRYTSIAMTMTGDAFESGKSVLTAEARKALSDVAHQVRRSEGETVVVEGHTDDVGAAAANKALSRARAEAAVRHLVEIERVPRSRFVVHAYGEERPVASNKTEEGRELNRRVEIHGERTEVRRARLYDVHREALMARVAGTEVPVDSAGRFACVVPITGDSIEVVMRDRRGMTAVARVPHPRLVITEPAGELRLPFGESAQWARVGPRDAAIDPQQRSAALETAADPRNRGSVATIRLRGSTDAGNRVTVDGVPVPVSGDGSFDADLPLAMGENAFGVVVEEPSGVLRVGNVAVSVSDRGQEGEGVVAIERIPEMTVYLPPAGAVLTTPNLAISGHTAPGNRVLANGDSLVVAADGSFSTTVALPEGKSQLSLDVVDSDGHRGSVVRDLKVQSKRFFLVGLADGVIGSSSRGVGDNGRTYTEGRIAYQLKGWIGGRVLVTSAFDSQRREWDSLFRDLDDAGQDRLLVNLDPDRLYPVFGDSSRVSYNTPGGGRFFLGVEADAVRASIGDFPIALDEVELASFHRTLYGAQVAVKEWAPEGSSALGTSLQMFGAQARQIHVRDVLQATGGTLYYLSHADIIEGSVQVNLVVRDRDTGLPLRQVRQLQGIDYTVKEHEGRLLFSRPVASVWDDGSLVDADRLHGHPVSLEIDYEARGSISERGTAGGRLTQRVGPVRIGGTLVNDQSGATDYQLRGGDLRAKLGGHSWLGFEIGESRGRASRIYESADGGLEFGAPDTTSTSEGRAWKISGELDPGEWLGSPRRATLSGYYRSVESGFVSDGEGGGHARDRFGVRGHWSGGSWGDWSMRFDRERRSGGAPGSFQGSTDLLGLQWRRDWHRMGTATEFEQRTADSVQSEPSRVAAMRLWWSPLEPLRATIERQQTLKGVARSQTALGIDWRVLSSLTLEARGADGAQGRSIRGGASLTAGGRKFYLREERQQSIGGDRIGRVLGFQAPLGPMSRAYSEYQWQHDAAGERVASLVGLEQGWRHRSGLVLRVSGEFAERGSAVGAAPHTAVSTDLTFQGRGPLSGTTRGEYRRGGVSGHEPQFLTATRLELRLPAGFSALFDFRESETKSSNPTQPLARFGERGVGLAYRPTRSDRLEGLARWTSLEDRRRLNPLDSTRVESGLEVASMEATVRVLPGLEWAAKAASRVLRDDGGGATPVTTKSTLWVNRIDYAITRPIRIGIQHHLLSQREAADRRQGFLQEISWEPAHHVRFGVGYNFSSFSGSEFDRGDKNAHGWFLRAQSRY